MSKQLEFELSQKIKELENLSRDLLKENKRLRQAESDFNQALENCQAEKSELKVMLELALWIISQHVIKHNLTHPKKRDII